MSRTIKSIVNVNQPEIVYVLKDLKPRQSIDKKLYPNYYNGLKEILNTVYTIYQAREKGTATQEQESEAMTQITEFLHTLGKANGKYISVCEKSTENGKTTVFFDTLVYNSFKDRIYTTSNELAAMECEVSRARETKNKAHKAMIEGKGTATAYKEAVKEYNKAVSQVKAEREKDRAENEMTVKESEGKFIKFVTSRLKAIVNNRYAITEEEAKAIRKIHNKETKERRSEAKPDGKEAEKKTA